MVERKGSVQQSSEQSIELADQLALIGMSKS